MESNLEESMKDAYLRGGKKAVQALLERILQRQELDELENKTSPSSSRIT